MPNNNITDKIKMAIKISGKTHKEFAEFLGMSYSALNNKYSRGSFSAEDLIKVAEFTGSTLSFEFDKTIQDLSENLTAKELMKVTEYSGKPSLDIDKSVQIQLKHDDIREAK